MKKSDSMMIYEEVLSEIKKKFTQHAKRKSKPFWELIEDFNDRSRKIKNER